MDLLWEMSDDERSTLYWECVQGDGHEPTGEYFATTNPIYFCYWCGTKFQVKDDGTTDDWKQESWHEQ